MITEAFPRSSPSRPSVSPFLANSVGFCSVLLVSDAPLCHYHDCWHAEKGERCLFWLYGVWAFGSRPDEARPGRVLGLGSWEARNNVRVDDIHSPDVLSVYDVSRSPVFPNIQSLISGGQRATDALHHIPRPAYGLWIWPLQRRSLLFLTAFERYIRCGTSNKKGS